MPTTIDRTGVLQAALLGFEMQRGRIEAAIVEIQTELGGVRPGRSTAAVAAKEPKMAGSKRFSVEARKRMAAAQRKRYRLVKAKKAAARKVTTKAAVKRQKSTAAHTAKKVAVKVKLAKKVVKVAPKPKAKVVPKPKASKPATPLSPMLVEVPVPESRSVMEAQPATV